jgi:cytochrome c oxidase cbb3-type subunit 3
MINNKNMKRLVPAFLFPSIAFCQEQAVKSQSSYFSNELFITLMITIIVLAIVIVAFSSVFKNIADSDFLSNKYGKNKNDNNIISSVIFIFLALSSFSAYAEGAQSVITPVKDDGRIGGIDPFTFYFLVVVILIELVVLSLMIYQFNYLVKTQSAKKVIVKPLAKSKIIKSAIAAVDIEDEHTILLDHDYDGIRELDNDLPPWWKYGFYLTIVFAFVYMIHYHVIGTGELQLEEYNTEMTKAKADVDAYMKNSASNVDESTVKMLTDAADLATGKDVYKASCAACHGQSGEGGVGPNLCDDYWLHGGSVQDVFKSIKYGWVEKGMKSWKEDLSPMQIAQITSFIKSIRGTNPPNGKAPQGDIFKEEGSSTLSPSDSTNTLSSTQKVDSLSSNK